MKRIKPERAFWQNGYQASALFDNAEHTRKPVISIFKESKQNPVGFASRVRTAVSETIHEVDRV